MFVILVFRRRFVFRFRCIMLCIKPGRCVGWSWVSVKSGRRREDGQRRWNISENITKHLHQLCRHFNFFFSSLHRRFKVPSCEKSAHFVNISDGFMVKWVDFCVDVRNKWPDALLPTGFSYLEWIKHTWGAYFSLKVELGYNNTKWEFKMCWGLNNLNTFKSLTVTSAQLILLF